MSSEPSSIRFAQLTDAIGRLPVARGCRVPGRTDATRWHDRRAIDGLRAASWNGAVG